MFKDTSVVCKSKKTIEDMPDYISTYGKNDRFIYYEAIMYSHIFGELKHQVSKEQHDKLVVGKTYTLLIIES